MARAAVTKAYFNFIAGRHSDGSALVPQPNTARILQNVDLETSGKISRRLGLDYEEDFVLSTDTFTDEFLRSNSVGFHEWTTVSEDGRRNFFVVRVGETIYFYNQSGEIISNTLLGTLDISPFSINTAVSNNSPIQVASGKGVLFVSGEDYEPFYVEYDTILETFTGVQISLTIRDFEGVDDGLAIDERPSTLEDLHHYNLLNQGWPTSAEIVTTAGDPPNSFLGNPITGANTAIGSYPSNADIIHILKGVAKNTSQAVILPDLDGSIFGNTPAPKGHYLLDAFNEDRQAASGIFGLPIGGDNRRPRSIAFFAGRTWYGGLRGKIYFSQIVEDLGKVGNCYQLQDPTAEDFNELLDTDGGVISIPEIGEVLSLSNVGNGLLVMANNGIWLIGGDTENFTANTAAVSKISEVGIVSYKSVVLVENKVFFWSEEGIFVVAPSTETGRLAAISLTDNRLNKVLNTIPALSKIATQGSYDRVAKKIYWSYHDGLNSTSDALQVKYNAILIYDVQLNAFYDYRIEDAGFVGFSSFAAGLLKGSARNEGISTENVVVNGVQVVVSGDPVQTTISFSGAAETLPKVLTFAHDAGVWKLTFSEFCSRTFHDWFSQDSIGANFTSIVETNPESLGDEGAALDKQATYLTTFYDFQRGGFGEVLTDPRVDPGKGFRVSQNVVEVLRAGIPKLRASQNVVEVLRQGTPKLRASQNVIEILRDV